MSMPIYICARCNSALDLALSDNGVSWIHPSSAAHTADHRPEPISPPPGWSGLCDFCTGPHPTHVLPASPFPVPGVAGHMSGGDWAACPACADLITADQWPALVDRAAAWYLEREGIPMSRQQRRVTLEIYRRLQLHVTGPVRDLRSQT